MLFSVYDRTGKRRMFYTTVESCIPSRDTIDALLKSGYIIKKTEDDGHELPVFPKLTAQSPQAPIAEPSISQQRNVPPKPVLSTPVTAPTPTGPPTKGNPPESAAMSRKRGRKPGKKSPPVSEPEDFTQLSM